MTTKPLPANKIGVVNAQVSGEGPSQVRAVSPGEHHEQSSREARALAIEFLKVQEEALTEEPLPLTRQEQVLRYFTALRRQLVESEPKQP